MKIKLYKLEIKFVKMASQFVKHSNARHLEGSWMIAIRFIRNVKTYGIRDLAVLVLQIRSRELKIT